MSKPDGGPAFACASSATSGKSPSYQYQGGMTLRQWFAGNAPEIPKAMPDYIGNPTDIARVIANWRYIYADAMIAEGEK